ncbi:head maturation protease, ClpP-related [Leuconostoc pseudomesenteroides]|uniref:head maturation protease, ClpP-related n=1 Tax=Leuconostoc pseudomesenteroides TaxID=33968 RepID=UPI0028A0CF36|nr:head maturation protease, ClpP-related [Leuconostoc pseudomesenteroides]
MTKTIDVKGDVVDDQTAMFYQWFDMACVNPSNIASLLANGDPNEDVVLNVASGGGDVFAASEIYTMLRQYAGKVVVNIQGLAASAASVISMAGDTVNISPAAQMMIHQASIVSQGNKDDLEHQANVLDGIDQSIAATYEAKTGMAQSDLLKLMSDETWLTAQNAVDKGFADNIMFVDEKQAVVTNTVSPIPSKAAVNKLMNLISKAQPVDNYGDKTPKNKPENNKSELKNKLALLYGRKDKENK